MNISEKLKIVLKLTNLTQEKLAKELGVSFVAFNNWINNKAVPRKTRLVKIESLYTELTGQKQNHSDNLSEKKSICKKLSKKYRNIIDFILNNSDIKNDLILSLTYNSNKIEGSTLTQDETAAIIFDEISLKNKSLKEHLEAKNHQTALEYLFEYISGDKPINEKFILKLHAVLMNSILSNAGNYRNHNVRIVGSNIPTSNYLSIYKKMKELIKEINKKNTDIIKHVTTIHSKFEQIHPFSDGNGRIGRLLLQAMLLKQNLAPAIIEQKTKRKYLKYLNDAQSKNDYSNLEEYFCEAIIIGFSKLDRK
jgi:Fic family protein